MINNVRGTTRIAIPSGMQQHPAGAPAFALQRLHMSQFTGYDPNSRLASAASDGGEGTGWSISLTGGLGALGDPFDGAYWIGSIGSIFGTKLSDTDLHWELSFQLIERTSPGLSTDYNVALGVCNEASDSGTIEALLHGIRYPASRLAQGVSVANGTATITTQGGAALRGAIFTVQKVGLGSTARAVTIPQASVDAALAPVAATLGAGGATVASFGDTEPLLVVAAWRSASTAGTATGVFDFYAGLGASWRAAT